MVHPLMYHGDLVVSNDRVDYCENNFDEDETEIQRN